MADRTLRFYGQGYGTAPVTLVATMDGVEVYSGPIPTVDGPYDPNTQDIMFTTIVPTDFTGTKAMVFTATGGDFMFARTTANYDGPVVQNPVFSPEQYAVLVESSIPRTEKLPIWKEMANPPLTPEEENFLLTAPYADIIPTLTAHNIHIRVDTGEDDWGTPNGNEGESRTDVVVNGFSCVSPNPTGGDWSWPVPLDGSTGVVTFTQNIIAAFPAPI